MKEEIRKLLQKVIGNEVADFSVEIPGDKNHGDYSSNIALVLAKKAGKNPKEVAEEIKNKIQNKLFKKVEVAGPGFINFFIKDEIFVDTLKTIDNNYGKGKELKNKKIAVEYTDPNILKDFHIGHLMGNIVGESLSRLFEFEGGKVKRFCYQGDVGMHVAKAIWGKIEDKNGSWGKLYSWGAKAYEESQTARDEIMKINKKIYEKSDKEINKLYEAGKRESLESFDKIYKKLGTKFDYFIFESDVADIGKKIVEKNIGKIFEKGENGAVIFPGEKFGLHTRVFINAEGLPTYEAKELGLATVKYKKYGYNQSVVVAGNEVNDYFKVLLAAMSQIFPDLQKKTVHIGHGMLRLPEGKMSSRTGNVITAESLIAKVEELVAQKIEERKLSDAEKKEIVEVVAIGAIKYSILRQSIGSDIIYDFDKSISFEGDSGPYVQYSYVRAQSILRKAKAEKIKASFKKVPAEISELEKALSYFPDAVAESEKKYEPHHLVVYLTQLASLFNGYYAQNTIVDRADEYSPYRIALTESFATVMKNGLWLLGIKTLEKM